MELLLKIIRIVSDFDDTEHIENMFHKPARFQPFGAGVKILNQQKDKPHYFPVNKSQSEGEHEKDQLVGFKPKYLKGSGEILWKLLPEIILVH